MVCPTQAYARFLNGSLEGRKREHPDADLLEYDAISAVLPRRQRRSSQHRDGVFPYANVFDQLIYDICQCSVTSKNPGPTRHSRHRRHVLETGVTSRISQRVVTMTTKPAREKEKKQNKKLFRPGKRFLTRILHKHNLVSFYESSLYFLSAIPVTVNSRNASRNKVFCTPREKGLR